MIHTEAAARALVGDLADDQALARLDRLVAILREENAEQNLVSKPTLGAVWQRHIADSAQLLRHVPRETPPWLDLGTGAGFPGLVIAAMRPEWDVRLIESRKRRIDWLERACRELELGNCYVIGARLENVKTVAAGVISARAFAPLPKLLTLSRRFSTAETLWLLPKGRSAGHELNELPPRLAALFHVEQSLTDPDSGIVIGSGVEHRGAP